jgi:hypothetical protein
MAQTSPQMRLETVDGTCLVVEVDPNDEDNGITKIDKDSYQTAEQAEEDVERLWKEFEVQPKTNREKQWLNIRGDLTQAG